MCTAVRCRTLTAWPHRRPHSTDEGARMTARLRARECEQVPATLTYLPCLLTFCFYSVETGRTETVCFLCNCTSKPKAVLTNRSRPSLTTALELLLYTFSLQNSVDGSTLVTSHNWKERMRSTEKNGCGVSTVGWTITWCMHCTSCITVPLLQINGRLARCCCLLRTPADYRPLVECVSPNSVTA